jgi:superfamily II DNA/RNA helicase
VIASYNWTIPARSHSGLVVQVLVFCTTARSTALMAELSTKLGLNSLEIHSRKSQAYRTRVSDTFRNSEGGVIMYTSDVSARGVDYPDVTLVIQVLLKLFRTLLCAFAMTREIFMQIRGS